MPAWVRSWVADAGPAFAEPAMHASGVSARAYRGPRIAPPFRWSRVRLGARTERRRFAHACVRQPVQVLPRRFEPPVDVAAQGAAGASWGVQSPVSARSRSERAVADARRSRPGALPCQAALQGARCVRSQRHRSHPRGTMGRPRQAVRCFWLGGPPRSLHQMRLIARPRRERSTVPQCCGTKHQDPKWPCVGTGRHRG